MDEGAGRPLPAPQSAMPSVGDAKRTLSVSRRRVDGADITGGEGACRGCDDRRAARLAQRVRDKGGILRSGRKTGAEWVTEPMRKRASEEARKLAGGWSPPLGPQDRKLVLALLRSANGSLKAKERAKEYLRAVAMQRAMSPSPCYVGLIAMAEQRLRERTALGRGIGGQGSQSSPNPALLTLEGFRGNCKRFSNAL